MPSPPIEYYCDREEPHQPSFRVVRDEKDDGDEDDASIAACASSYKSTGTRSTVITSGTSEDKPNTSYRSDCSARDFGKDDNHGNYMYTTKERTSYLMTCTKKDSSWSPHKRGAKENGLYAYEKPQSFHDESSSSVENSEDIMPQQENLYDVYAATRAQNRNPYRAVERFANSPAEDARTLSTDGDVSVMPPPLQLAVQGHFRMPGAYNMGTEGQFRRQEKARPSPAPLERERSTSTISWGNEGNADSVTTEVKNDKESHTRPRRRCMLVSASVVVFLVGIVALIFVLAVPTKNTKNTKVIQVIEPSPSPTPAPTNYVPTSEDEAIDRMARLRGILVANLLRPEDDPRASYEYTDEQEKAMRWLVYDDPARMKWDETSSRAIFERFVLAVLYWSTNGDGWDKSYRFLSASPICAWNEGEDQDPASGTVNIEDDSGYGVYCDGDGHVDRILLGGNRLEGSIPSELTALTDLKTVSFRYNKLTGTIPDHLWQLDKLEAWDITGNSLSGTIPSAFDDLTNLQYLHLGSNVFRGTIPELGNLKALKSFVLRMNRLTGTIPKSIGDMTDLQALVLSELNLKGTVPTELGMLTSVTDLNVGANLLHGTIPTEFANLENLTILSVAANNMSGDVSKALENMSSLRSVFLHQNQFTGNLDRVFCSPYNPRTGIMADCDAENPKVTCSCCNCSP